MDQEMMKRVDDLTRRVLTIFWYWNSRTFQGPSNFIFKDQF